MIFLILVTPLILSTYSSFLRRVAAPLREHFFFFLLPLHPDHPVNPVDSFFSSPRLSASAREYLH